jgi:hypothetical protein
VPGSSDAALFDASSGSGTATLDISPTVQTLTMTGFTGTLAFGTNTISLNSTGTVFTGATTMTVTGTPQIILTDNSATARTISPQAVTEANSISFRITAGTGTLTINTGSIRNLDFTDGTNPTGYAGAYQNSVPTIYGNFKASTGMTKVAGTGTFTFAATSGTKTITTAAVVFDNPFTFNGVGGTWQLQDALTSGATRTCTLTAGTLDLNNFTLTTGLFSSSTTSTRVLAFGTGNITLTGVNTTIFDTTTVTNMTITGTPVVNCTATTGTSVQTRIFILGNHGEAQAISVNINPGTSAVDIFRFATNSGAFKDVTFSNTFTGTIQISNTVFFYGSVNFGGATAYTGNSTLTFAATSGTKTIRTSGLTIDAAVTFNGVGGTWQLQDALTSGDTRTCTLSAGTLDLNNFTLTTGLFSSNTTSTRVLAFGTGNITVTAVSGIVFVGPTSGNTGLTTTGTAQVNVTGNGTTTRTIRPGNAAAITGFISFTISAGSDTISSTAGMTFNNLTFTSGFTGTFSAFGGVTLNLFGNLTLDANTNLASGASVLTFNGTGNRTITTAGETFDFPVTFDGIGGAWAMQDALTLGATQPLTFTNGTLQLKAGTTSTVGSFVTSGTTLKYLQSTIPGTQATISDASGTDAVTYLSVRDSNATGGATWDATDPTNVNAGNNAGWIFRMPDFGGGVGSGGTCFGFGFRI